MNKKATWINGKRTVTGHWKYYWPSDVFIINLDSIDKITGEKKRLMVHNDTPEWGNWKLIKGELNEQMCI